ncbi:MAG: hypothetical protein B7Y88_00380 [Sphingomonadales bacterium 32-64-17]|nr:MAG: hypothetical protein B7Y88_00380 [Sphingomonadales bacterium 32-64-17]
MQQIAEDFWNIRGSFKIAKVLDIGTHMSVARRSNGQFLLLDSYAIGGEDKRRLVKLTDNGAAIDAIINVHPFHTLHCSKMHELFPGARMIGTARHKRQAPDVDWDDDDIEDASTQAEFAQDLDFSVPAGLDLVTGDDSVHAASVLVRHKASGVVHVDDTLTVLAAPGALKPLLPQSRLKFHPKLADALQPRAGAADDFARWAIDLASDWGETPAVCAAHSAVRHLQPGGWREEVLRALGDVEKALAKHRAEYG